MHHLRRSLRLIVLGALFGGSIGCDRDYSENHYTLPVPHTVAHITRTAISADTGVVGFRVIDDQQRPVVKRKFIDSRNGWKRLRLEFDESVAAGPTLVRILIQLADGREVEIAQMDPSVGMTRRVRIRNGEVETDEFSLNHL